MIERFKTSEVHSAGSRGPSTGAPPIRTYRQIADIIEARDGTPISPDRVRQICQAAETKIVHALVDGPLQQWILAILADQSGSLLSTTVVEQMCFSESRRLVLALLTEPQVRGRPGSRVASGRQARHRVASGMPYANAAVAAKKCSESLGQKARSQS